MDINWYPGHMKKTRELLKEQLKLVDMVFELLDARIPLSSKNPIIDEIIGNKPKIVILNKYDLAHEGTTRQWVQYYKKQGIKAIAVNTLEGKGLKEALSESENVTKDKMAALIEKGRKARAIRSMMVGIPNVGKSSIINQLTGRKSAKTGDRPGVTKGKQWVRIRGNIELLDTPGILWPKFEDQEVALNLAFTGAIKDEIMDIETLALKLVERLWEQEKDKLIERYKLKEEFTFPLEIMDIIAKNRGCIVSGGEIDYSRVSHMILDEFRGGKIGRISLEQPPIL
ncbi:Ras superfamily GTP-binding protein YlqF [Natronincola peptidivorans]|uniref:Ribosome biogenesis GTPase A n=1 Tax=Natronincola peptidivorans TaxID=426128 RepID=A0A1H9YDI3_9FIRM|nr:ribosome biogenesis GTPase YlqF [Natronincola peptidivorans]SES67030.1 Ras superfamily GTP-binding protein YlqF [Natronincola peptidivorans]